MEVIKTRPFIVPSAQKQKNFSPRNKICSPKMATFVKEWDHEKFNVNVDDASHEDVRKTSRSFSISRFEARRGSRNIEGLDIIFPKTKSHQEASFFLLSTYCPWSG